MKDNRISQYNFHNDMHVFAWIIKRIVTVSFTQFEEMRNSYDTKYNKQFKMHIHFFSIYKAAFLCDACRS